MARKAKADPNQTRTRDDLFGTRLDEVRSTSTKKSGSNLFIVDNSDQYWKVLHYLHDWCQFSRAIDIASGYFEIGSLVALDGEWQKVDQIRILMGDEVSRRTKQAFVEGLEHVKHRLDASIETEKEHNDFLIGVPAIVEAIESSLRDHVYQWTDKGSYLEKLVDDLVQRKTNPHPAALIASAEALR